MNTWTWKGLCKRLESDWINKTEWYGAEWWLCHGDNHPVYFHNIASNRKFWRTISQANWPSFGPTGRKRLEVITNWIKRVALPARTSGHFLLWRCERSLTAPSSVPRLQPHLQKNAEGAVMAGVPRLVTLSAKLFWPQRLQVMDSPSAGRLHVCGWTHARACV